ncbi:MAG: inositol monophosphatase family protein [Pseudomonadota bacterium]|nr:inositol monophosphatase family protein [Pseudomonadota bacterium]
MEPMLNIAIRAARLAGTVISRATARLDEVKFDKKGELNYVSEVDTQAEAIIIETLLEAYPDHAILAEESGQRGESDYLWIVDPLDGTRNFLNGYPQFCVSIALSIKGKLQQAVVYDPVRDELFSASRGGGALLNDRRIRVGGKNRVEQTLLATGFPVNNSGSVKESVKRLEKVLARGADIRRGGSAALDLAYVACGRLDGYWEFNLNSWDIAAGALLISESGGIICDRRASENFLESGEVITSNPKLLKQLLPLLS